MSKQLLLFFFLSSFCSFGQNHEENLRSITTIEAANKYAASFNEVSCGIMHAEKDRVFFDDIDTSNLEQSVGTSISFFGRTTKLLKDTIVDIVNVQLITFDLTQMSAETAHILIGQMTKRLESGETYWAVKQKFGHTSAEFYSGPENVSLISTKYNVSEDEMIENAFFEWEYFSDPHTIGILIIETAPHEVPGFYTISYLNLEDGSFR